ncbi:uncharacterized protein ATNIH1004_000458 [Aspergillus tanneri]|uniref:Uncharacterized protein n=1 Tax=Aspergillus tanneri TaxID=1220188 RepID=A0A5M9MXF8_9EURO|nr:uncharacterized protein ATNIH1004_000458 [Aspergillus tanneri]KAA8651568.1 hypothetical protein ATNIH1004_000458 [Aspergillus tanneri]
MSSFKKPIPQNFQKWGDVLHIPNPLQTSGAVDEVELVEVSSSVVVGLVNLDAVFESHSESLLKILTAMDDRLALSAVGLGNNPSVRFVEGQLPERLVAVVVGLAEQTVMVMRRRERAQRSKTACRSCKWVQWSLIHPELF